MLPGNQSAKDGKMVNLDRCGAELGGWLSVPARQGRKKEIAVVCRKYGWLAAWLDTVIIFYKKTSLTSDLALDDSRLKAVFKLSQGKTALTDL